VVTPVVGPAVKVIVLPARLAVPSVGAVD